MGVGVRDGVEDRVRVRAWVRDKFRVRVRVRIRVRARVRARVRDDLALLVRVRLVAGDLLLEILARVLVDLDQVDLLRVVDPRLGQVLVLDVALAQLHVELPAGRLALGAHAR